MPTPLDSLLTAPGIARIIRQIPTELLANSGGVWDRRIQDVNASDDELTMFNSDVPVSADLIAPSATSRDVTEGPNITRLDRAFRLKQSSKLTHTDLKYLMKLADMGGLGREDSAGLATWLTRIKANRIAGVAILRGRLKAGMAQGAFTYNQGGYQYTTDFGMDPSMKVTPGTLWLNSAGTPNTSATPVSDVGAIQTAAYDLEGRRFNAIDLPRVTFRAVLQTTEYQNLAKQNMVVAFSNSLPNSESPKALELFGAVFASEDGPLKVTIDDQRYQVENTDGTRSSGFYLDRNYAVLSNTDDYNNAGVWDFANVPITEGVIANAVGRNDVFGGAQRGPVGYFTADLQEFNWMRSHATQEGTPRRWLRTASARITARGG